MSRRAWLVEGSFLVEIERIKLVERKVFLFAVEAKILESSAPELSVGAEVAHVFATDYFLDAFGEACGGDSEIRDAIFCYRQRVAGFEVVPSRRTTARVVATPKPSRTMRGREILVFRWSRP